MEDRFFVFGCGFVEHYVALGFPGFLYLLSKDSNPCFLTMSSNKRTQSILKSGLVLCVSLAMALPKPSFAQAPAPASVAPASVQGQAPAVSQAPQQVSKRTTPPPRGLGMIISGSALATLIGVPLTLLGFMGLAATEAAKTGAGAVGANELKPSMNQSRGLIIGGCIVPGLLSIAGGTAMVYFGARRNARFRSWKRSATAGQSFTLSPMVASTPRRTGVLGFQGRF